MLTGYNRAEGEYRYSGAVRTSTPIPKLRRWVLALQSFYRLLCLSVALLRLINMDAERKGARLGVLAASKTSFVAVVGLFTNARKAELFVATAGFTAVLVVYVGSAS
jgi:hypothetical protein